MKLLIIDDEPHIRQMMRLTLEAGGYQVDDAPDGDEGLALFGDGRGYDAIVLDQKMPGLTGLETLKRIKARAPGARVLMVTAFASIDLAVDAMKLGATDFLRKPMTPETLRGAVAAALAGLASHPSIGPEPARGAGQPEIETLTLNGFRIRRSPEAADPTSFDHTLRVRQFSTGVELRVTVGIDPDAVERVARLTRRRLDPGGAFWRAQAERLLSAYLWSEGKCPDGGRLTVHDVSREDLEIVGVWKSN